MGFLGVCIWQKYKLFGVMLFHGFKNWGVGDLIVVVWSLFPFSSLIRHTFSIFGNSYVIYNDSFRLRELLKTIVCKDGAYVFKTMICDDAHLEADDYVWNYIWSWSFCNSMAYTL